MSEQAGIDAIMFLLDPKAFAWETGFTFRGLTISQNATGYNIVIRAFRNDGQPVYAMTNYDDPEEGFRRLWQYLRSSEGERIWRLDRYAR